MAESGAIGQAFSRRLISINDMLPMLVLQSAREQAKQRLQFLGGLSEMRGRAARGGGRVVQFVRQSAMVPSEASFSRC